MSEFYIGFIGLMVGILGTGLGSIIGVLIKKTNRISSFLLGLTGGFMLFIVSFHLFPEAFYIGGLFIVLSGVLIGLFIIVVLEILLEKLSYSSFIKTSIILALSVAIHNLPEGMALGSTLVGMSDFGFVLVLAMFLHNIPEGIAISIPLSMKKIKKWKIILFAIIAGIPTGIGAYLGAYLGSISSDLIAFSLSLAGGIMLYIVCDELIPKGKSLYKGKTSSVAVIIGFLLGIILYFR